MYSKITMLWQPWEFGLRDRITISGLCKYKTSSLNFLRHNLGSKTVSVRGASKIA